MLDLIWEELVQPLMAIEFFAGDHGSARIAKCFAALGYHAKAFDISRCLRLCQ